MSNRKAHRRDRSFHRYEHFVPHYLRRPLRRERFDRQLEERAARRKLWATIRQWLGIGEIPESLA